MAKDPQIYTLALSKFKNIYKMDRYDLKQSIENERRFRFLNGTDNHSTDKLYARYAASALSTYFTSVSKFKENGACTLSNFTLDKFMQDFEELFDAAYRSELEKSEDYNRVARNGADPNYVKRACLNAAKLHNETLPNMWKDRIRKGEMNIAEMEAVTDKLHERLLDGNGEPEDLKDDFNKLVAATVAMDEVRKSRQGFIGFFWRLFHREQNRAEENYQMSLNAQLGSLRGKYDIDKVTSELKQKTFLGKAVKGARKDKVNEAAVNATKVAKKSAKIEAVTDRIDELLSDNDVKDDFFKEINDIIPGKPQEKDTRYISLKYINGPTLAKDMKKINESFDEGLASGKDHKRLVGKLVRDAFERANYITTLHLKEDNVDVRARVNVSVAKAILNKFTAVALYRDQLGGMVDKHMDRTVAMYKEAREEDESLMVKFEKYESDLEKGLVSEDDPIREPAINPDDKTFFENNFDRSNKPIEELSKGSISRNADM